MKIIVVRQEEAFWARLQEYAKKSVRIMGRHLAGSMEDGCFSERETVFAALEDEEIAGFCTFLMEKHEPEPRYSPRIGTVFVGEGFHVRRVSQLMIEEAVQYAKDCGFGRVYISSDIKGFYEKLGFVRIDGAAAGIGDEASLFMREI